MVLLALDLSVPGGAVLVASPMNKYEESCTVVVQVREAYLPEVGKRLKPT